MKDPVPQSALREMRRHMAQPVTWITLAGVSLILGIAGPFETGELMRFVPRCLYWFVVASLSWAAGTWISEALSRRRLGLPLWLWVGVTGVLIGFCVCAIVWAVNALSFGYVPTRADLPGFLGSVIGISIVVAAVSTALSRNHAQTQSAGPKTPAKGTPLLDRLPIDKRGPLIALSVEDHYVHVRTTKGTEMILIRLSDAIREIGDTPGAQVHRSHWIAFDQVASARRQGDRAILTMVDGADIPVSRPNVAKLKEAGLLPV